MKWERIKEYYNDGTYEVRGYKMGEYTIEPQYIFGYNRPNAYSILKNGKYMRSRETLKEAKQYVENLYK